MLKPVFVLLIHFLNHLQLLLHSLKPSSFIYSLQIYCIGLARLEFAYPLGIVLKPSPYNHYANAIANLQRCEIPSKNPEDIPNIDQD